MISIHKNILSVDALLSNAFTLTGQTHWEYTCPNNIFSGLNSWTMDGGTGGAYLRITNYELRFQGIRAQSAFQQSESAAEF